MYPMTVGKCLGIRLRNDWAALGSRLERPRGVRRRGSPRRRRMARRTRHAAFRSSARSAKIPLLHLWSDERNLTRRVLRVKESDRDRIMLEVQRFGRAKPGRLEFLAQRFAPRPRAHHARTISRALCAHPGRSFPGRAVDSLTAAPDLEHSFSGLYVRGACTKARTPGRCSALLRSRRRRRNRRYSFALEFLARLDTQPRHGVPSKACASSCRMEQAGACANARLRSLLQCARKFSNTRTVTPDAKMDSADAGNLESWLVPRAKWILCSLRAARRRIACAPCCPAQRRRHRTRVLRRRE